MILIVKMWSTRCEIPDVQLTRKIVFIKKLQHVSKETA